MKFYTFWAKAEYAVDYDGETVLIPCYGGSDQSPEEALQAAQAKASVLRQGFAWDRRSRLVEQENYEVTIREEVVQRMNPQSVITRNRYGALILNTTDLTILDVDDYKTTWKDLFKAKAADKKQRIIDDITKIFEKQGATNECWRLYETSKGVRVIVVGRYYDPLSPEFNKLAKDMNADSLYVSICRKQNCFRARLTPKPSRIGVSSIRYLCPIPAGCEAEYSKWVNDYHAASLGYGTCRLLKILGDSSMVSQTMFLHDKACCREGCSLA